MVPTPVPASPSQPWDLTATALARVQALLVLPSDVHHAHTRQEPETSSEALPSMLPWTQAGELGPGSSGCPLADPQLPHSHALTYFHLSPQEPFLISRLQSVSVPIPAHQTGLLNRRLRGKAFTGLSCKPPRTRPCRRKVEGKVISRWGQASAAQPTAALPALRQRAHRPFCTRPQAAETSP